MILPSHLTSKALTGEAGMSVEQDVFEPKVRKALRLDIHRISNNLREADLQEIAAATGEDPHAALLRSFTMSEECYSVILNDDDEEPVAVFGVVQHPEIEDYGIIWMVGTDKLTDIRTTFLRKSKDWIKQLFGDKYKTIGNFVDQRNEVHVRWLQWCGFTLNRIVPHFGVEKLPFYEFYLEKP